MKKYKDLVNFRKLFPPGRAWDNVAIEDTVMFKFMSVIVDVINEKIEIINKVKNGLYPTESDIFFEEFKADYNHNFSTKIDIIKSMQDIYIIKYLLKNDTEENIRRIWNAFGIGISIKVDPDNPKILIIKPYTAVSSGFILAGRKRLGYRFPIYFSTEQLVLRANIYTRFVLSANYALHIDISATEHERSNYKGDPNECDFIVQRIGGKVINRITEYNVNTIHFTGVDFEN